MNNIQGDRQYLKYWRAYLDNPEICTSKFQGKYCIEFRNFKAAEFFNSIETSKMLSDCEYYPPSIIVKIDSVCIGKNFIRNSKPSFPFLVQDRIQPKFDNDGESVFILYVKKNNIISAYYAPTSIENKSSLLECLCNIQEFIIPKFDTKNYCEIEYFLTEFEVIEDKNNKFWVKGVNWDPKFSNDLEKMVDDIFYNMNNSGFNYFEKLVQTHCSNSSF